MTLNSNVISMLQTIVAMGLLNLVMFVWMYATRIPAMNRRRSIRNRRSIRVR